MRRNEAGMEKRAKEKGDRNSLKAALADKDLVPNWYALTICILKKSCLSPEVAFALIDGDKKPEVDAETLMELKKTMTYKELGELYGLKADAVYNRIRRHKEKAALRERRVREII